MKKFGFTLAEILISLAIVGVVAAITIPTLGTDARKQANLATLKTTISDFENAFSAVLISHGADSFDEQNSQDNWIKEYEKHLKVNVEQEAGGKIQGKTKNGCEYELSSTKSGGTLKLDVNGENGKPNKDGVDQFTIDFDKYGLFDIETLNEYLGKNDSSKN